MNKRKKSAKDIWQQYQNGLDYLNRFDYFKRTEDSFRFFNGEQWDGVATADSALPSYNILKPIVEHKLSIVAKNTMTINYSSTNYNSNYAYFSSICKKLNAHAKKTWDRLKLDKLSWDMLLDSAICGNAFAYYYWDAGQINLELVDATNIFFADEQQRDIQKQKYIIVSQRLYVEDIRKIAKANKVVKDEIDMILSDEDTSTQLGEKAKREVDNEDLGKCTCLLKMWKEDGVVCYSKSVKNVIYQPDTRIEGLSLYPIAHMTWLNEKGTCRGGGEVFQRIPNQIEINKSLARYLVAIKQYAYPHLIYDKSMLSKESVNNLSLIGANIAIASNRLTNVTDAIGYLEPAQINPMAQEIILQMTQTTRELAGASDAATGQIDPEKTSGAAIIAVRDASAVSLNQQIASYKEFIEDFARIWFDMWVAYNPNGLRVVIEDEVDGSLVDAREELIDAESLKRMKVDIRIDISPSNPYSKYAQEQALQNLFTMKAITFEEYVNSLDDDATSPKEKLKEILKERKAVQLQEAILQNINESMVGMNPLVSG